MAKCPFHGHVPGLFSSDVANDSPLPGPSACPWTAMLLSGSAAGTCTCEGGQDNLSAPARLGLYRGRSNAEQQWSFWTVFPMFCLLGKQHDIARTICIMVHTPPHHSLRLQGAGVTSGFTRNNPNLAEQQLRANESCRTQPDSAQSQMDAFATCIPITSSFCWCNYPNPPLSWINEGWSLR